MKSWLTQLRREFWEYNASFLVTPVVIAALVVVAGIYVVIVYGTPDSKLAREFFGDSYVYENSNNGVNGKTIDSPTAKDSGTAVTAQADTGTDEYIIDFSKGEQRPLQASDLDNSITANGYQAGNASLYGIHQLFLTITAFVLLFYMINSLYADRKDRSVLFWKSMPVSETRNVAVKYITSVLAVPVVVTLISWIAQISYLVLATIFVYRIGSDPWGNFWSHIDVMGAFFEQLKYILWLGAWFLPFNAWWLFASALARRSPFLVATIPFAFVILMEKLLFGSYSIGLLLLQHLKAAGIQVGNIIGDEVGEGVVPGNVDLFMNNSEMLIGFFIAGVLFAATVWLRNHRFEI